MPGGIKSDIKFGFWSGLGFMLMIGVAMAFQMLLSRARGGAQRGGGSGG
ncbi:MAG TPA: hypothetical protein VGV89_07195 [Thermoplasmata archaeon]|nr:hypothetical protein [Thermoplasmata archaeon]